MKRIWCVVCWCIVCAAAASFSCGAYAKEKISYSYLIDPVMEAFLYPIKSGKIKSDLIDIEMTPLSIPAAIQATATKQFDVVMTAAISIPRAAEKGLELKVLSVVTRYPHDSRGGDVWVLSKSPYKTIADLKGKTIAVSSFDSTGTTWIRLALWKKYNVNVRYEDGDFDWVQISAGAQPAALSTGKIDASTLIHFQALQALHSNDYRSIASTAKDNFELYGVPSVAAVNAAYPERLAANPEVYKEFNRILKASRDYALSHIDEVSEGVQKQTNMPVGYFKGWTTNIGDFPATMSALDIKSIGVLWKTAKELGLIGNYPDPNSVVWDQTLMVN